MANLKALKRVLDLKERLKEEAEMEVKKAFQALKIEEDKLTNLKNTRDRTIDTLNTTQEGSLTGIDELGLYYDYLHWLHGSIRKQNQAVDEKIVELDKRKEELAIAYRDMKTFEILRDRMAGRIEKQKERQWQKDMDFLHLSRLPRE